jgi:cyclohexanone monooxygenase
MSGNLAETDVDAVIVGAGFAGLYQLWRLRQRGFSVRVFEAGAGVGGTWHWNRYPGARCDVESVYYSYSFSPELDQEWTWSERYAAQPEILRYLEHVTHKFGLDRDITFSTRVRAARFDTGRQAWTVTTDTGESVGCRFLIMATGCLSVPKEPDIPGVGRFTGAVYHTSRWPHEGVDFTGLRVAVIGTGSSAVQSIPLIAEQAAWLTVFQRTPSYCMPARNRPLTAAETAAIRADYPEIRALLPTTLAGMPTRGAARSALEVTADERDEVFWEGWNIGGLTGLTGAFTDIIISQAANDFAAGFIRARIAETVTDPATAAALQPRSYPFGTKRPCLDTGYYETFNRPNVSLVDLRATPLEEITETGLRTTRDSYEFDAIVFATGFDAMTGALSAIDIRGRDGVSLREAWAAGPVSLLGLAIAGFPNLFTITGPMSPSVLSNMVVSIEQHVDWISDCLTYLRDNGLGVIEATPQAQADWVGHVADVAGATLYPKADSWYIGANVPGKPRVFMAYIGGVGVYREICDSVANDGYRGFAVEPAQPPPASTAAVGTS